MNFSGSLSSTSPASFSRETSFLQQAIARGESSLHGTSNGHGDARGHGKRRSGSSSASARLSFSAEGGRLSPPQEDVNEEEDDDNETAVSDEEEEAEGGETRGLLSPGTGTEQRGRRLSRAPSYHPATETTPLLGHSATTDGIVSAAEEAAIRQARKLDDDRRDAFLGEGRVLLKYTAPILFTHFLEYSLMATVVVSTGHLGETELAAASLSNLTNNTIALSVVHGLCAALDTLCPQAFSSSRPKDTSLYAIRTYIICLVVAIPQCIFFYHSEWILRDGLRQDPAVAKLAAQYLRIMSLAIPGYAGFECIRRWLQAQGMMVAPVLALVVAAPVNLALNYFLVVGPIDSIRLGFVGAPIASCISINLMFITMFLYSIFCAPRDAWGGWAPDLLSGFGLNIKLGLAGIGMVGSEWWSWEIVGLATSFLGPTALAAQSVLLTSASAFYQFQYALSVAAAVRIGNLLGAQKPHLARVTSRLTIAIAIVCSGVNSILLVLLRNKWGSLFSSEPEIIKLVANVLPLVAAFQLSDGLSGAMGGVLRGAGKPVLGAIINTASYYVLGLPVGITVAFVGPKLGLNGLWLGLTIALTFTGLSSTYIVWFMNWEQEAEQTRIRLGEAKRDEEQ
ncbi:MATE efflux family protein [Rhodotorula sp. JG-1b]|nr:MATE efflux family protein [Rhodotorula sp. JG-1b]